MPTLRSCLAAATALTALATPAAASAQSTVRYDYGVVIAGTVSYNQAREVPSEDGIGYEQLDDETSFRVVVPRTSFHEDFGEYTARALGTVASKRGHIRITPPKGPTFTCADHRVTDFTGGSFGTSWTRASTSVRVRVLENLTTSIGGCTGGLPPHLKRFDSFGAPVGQGPFDAKFDFPRSRIGDGTITFPISGGAAGQDCPGYDEETVLCSLTWEGTVTFTRTGEAIVPQDEGLEVPLVPTPPAKPTPPVPPTAEPALKTLAGAKLTATEAVVPITCAAACTGTATATTLPGARAAAAKKTARPLATTRFTARAGAPTKVVVKIPKARRAAVRKAGGVRITLKVTSAGRTTTRTLVVRAPRRR